MKNTHKLILGLAAASAIFAFTAAESLAQTVSTREKVVTQSNYSIGTRRVGMVGHSPYPLIVSQTDARTVQTTRHKSGRVSSDVTTTTYMYQDEPYVSEFKGGTYYTSVGRNYYPDGELNVRVVDTGSFNN